MGRPVKAKYVHREEGSEWAEMCPLEAPVWSDGSFIGLCCTSGFIPLIKRPVIDEKAFDLPGGNFLKRCKWSRYLIGRYQHVSESEANFQKLYCASFVLDVLVFVVI